MYLIFAGKRKATKNCYRRMISLSEMLLFYKHDHVADMGVLKGRLRMLASIDKMVRAILNSKLVKRPAFVG